jgi:hypothetical protein
VTNIIGKEDQAALVDESIKHAKEAVMLDIKDGNSWCKILLPFSEMGISSLTCNCIKLVLHHCTRHYCLLIFADRSSAGPFFSK